MCFSVELSVQPIASTDEFRSYHKPPEVYGDQFWMESPNRYSWPGSRYRVNEPTTNWLTGLPWPGNMIVSHARVALFANLETNRNESKWMEFIHMKWFVRTTITLCHIAPASDSERHRDNQHRRGMRSPRIGIISNVCKTKTNSFSENFNNFTNAINIRPLCRPAFAVWITDLSQSVASVMKSHERVRSNWCSWL